MVQFLYGKYAVTLREGQKMETSNSKYGLRLIREGITIGVIPVDTEMAARAAYWQMMSDPMYAELGVTFWVVAPDTEYAMTV